VPAPGAKGLVLLPPMERAERRSCRERMPAISARRARNGAALASRKSRRSAATPHRAARAARATPTETPSAEATERAIFTATTDTSKTAVDARRRRRAPEGRWVRAARTEGAAPAEHPVRGARARGAGPSRATRSNALHATAGSKDAAYPQRRGCRRAAAASISRRSARRGSAERRIHRAGASDSEVAR
jgi:hypothetical protein